jgi:hypothetical protein
MATSLVELLPADLRVEQPVIPPEQNAWEPLEAARRLFVGNSEDFPHYWPPSDPRNEGFAGSEADVRALLAANEPAIARLDEALARGQLVLPGPHADLALEFRVILNISRLLTLRVRCRLADGEVEPAIVDAVRLANAAELLLHSNTSNALSGMIMLVSASRSMREIADASAVTALQLQDLLSKAQPPTVIRKCYAAAMGNSLRDWAIPELQRLSLSQRTSLAEKISVVVDQMVGLDQCEPDLNDDELTTTSSQIAARRELFRGCLGYALRNHPFPFDEHLTAQWLVADALHAIYECHHLEPRRWCDVRGHVLAWRHWWRRRGRNRACYAIPGWMYVSWNPEFDDLYEDMAKGWEEHPTGEYYSIYVRPNEKRLETARQRMRKVPNPIGALLLAELTSSAPVLVLRLHEATLGLTQLVIALRLHELEHGRLPKRLRDLVRAGILDELPIDPFSGREFYYDAETATVWSAGDAEDASRGDEKPDDPIARRLAWQLTGHRTTRT